MDFIPKSKILEFRPDQLNIIRKQYNLDKLGDMDRAIDVLEAWIKMQKHFTKKKFPRDYLERSLILSKGSIERAKTRLDKICTFRTAMPEFFGDNLTKNRFDDIDCHKVSLMPKPTEEYCRVYVGKSIGSTFTQKSLLNLFRYILLVCEYIGAHDYTDGLLLILDYNEANLVELTKALSLTEVRQILTITIEGLAMRLKGIHMLTPSKAISALIAILKQFLSPKLAQRIYVHKEIDTLYQYVPKDILPVDYGGKEKSLAEQHDKLMKEITGKDFMSYIEEMNHAKVDETFRHIDTFNENYLGMPGSFRSLNVD